MGFLFLRMNEGVWGLWGVGNTYFFFFWVFLDLLWKRDFRKESMFFLGYGEGEVNSSRWRLSRCFGFVRELVSFWLLFS